MEKKDIIELALGTLLTLLCVAVTVLVAHEGFHYVFPLFLFTLWSLTLLWRSWKHIGGRYVPKLTEEEKLQENADEIVFSIPYSQKEFLKKTLFCPSASTTKTWTYLFITVLLTYFAVEGYALFFTLVMLATQLVRYGLSFRATYGEFCEIHSNYRKTNLLVIFNKNGMLGAIPRLSTEKGQNIVYIYTAFNDWAAIREIIFYKTYIEVNYSNNLKEYLVADNHTQLAQFKKMVNAYYRQPHQVKNVLNLQNYPAILKKICKSAIGVSTEEGNSFHLGESYIAPIPSVPKNFRWPVNHKLPLSFLAQINCKDLAPFDTENLLPKDGMLYFFYEMKEMLLNEQGNQGCARVVYSNVANDQLFFHKESTRIIDQNYLLRQRKLRFHWKNSMPNFAEAGSMEPSIALSSQETFNYTCWRFKKTQMKSENTNGEVAQFFGNPTFHSRRELEIEDNDDMVLLMQLTLHKEDFLAYHLGSHNNGAQNREFFNQWEELPCQLYYFIPRNDLKQLNFSNIRFVRRSKNLDELALPDDISGAQNN